MSDDRIDGAESVVEISARKGKKRNEGNKRASKRN